MPSRNSSEDRALAAFGVALLSGGFAGGQIDGVDGAIVALLGVICVVAIGFLMIEYWR